MAKKIYSPNVDYEKKLKTVMERFGVKKYSFDWTRSGYCYIEFTYQGEVYRFEDSIEKAKAKKQNISLVSDLFARLVLTLERLAKMVEDGTYELTAWIQRMNVKALPAANENTLPDCFKFLWYEEMPYSVEDLQKRYRQLAKAAHPDRRRIGGTFYDAAQRI